VNTFQEFINPFNPTRVNLHEKYNDSRKFKLTSLIILFSALAIQACGGSSMAMAMAATEQKPSAYWQTTITLI